jgi:hypothetical protein
MTLILASQTNKALNFVSSKIVLFYDSTLT